MTIPRAFLPLALGLFTLLLACSCGQEQSGAADQDSSLPVAVDPIAFTLEQAQILSELPLACVGQEYPNKLGQTLGSAEDLGEPTALHPAFYGCFDWHSAVHGHWSLVRLLKTFPDMEKAAQARELLARHLSEDNIAREVAYFQGEHAKGYERTYGWAWLLKLAEELHTWNDPLARALEANLQPLTAHISNAFVAYLPKLQYPVRVGTHTNTAFGLALAWDYAQTLGDARLKEAIRERALAFYGADAQCPLGWEPSGADFLSPCLEEMDLMRRVLDPEAFMAWSAAFLPGLLQPGFSWEPARVGDRSDGQLVHLDGLNFSRAWVFYGLANQYPETFGHLRALAHEHMAYSFPNLVGDQYEGGHWLGTFALYALETREAPNP
ncbi:DUF2891 domain-containing protein [Robiginitalea sp. M366]|uniref:DUF2891 domain-containing protein n=1 Tax=Robiginitalea aestuariiviva TaxID=3036903 RepID=UPI00240E7E7F|nr:DUF2891 domain-containing protein [Robiginitalea aestuariiviva]MDG1572673.1 DUF2891 domain-containing protein [Robiginitalea aestuariiviva]